MSKTQGNFLKTFSVFAFLFSGPTSAYASDQFGLICSSPDYSDLRFTLSYGKKFNARGTEFYGGAATNYSLSGAKKSNWDFMATSEEIMLTLEEGRYALQFFSINRYNLSAGLVKRDNSFNFAKYSFKCKKVPALQIVTPQKQRI